MSNDKQNDKEAALAESLKIEEEDAEALLNDIEFEPPFEKPVVQRGHKLSGEERKEGVSGPKANSAFKELHGNTKKLDVDFEDRVACNCSLLEVRQVFEGDSCKDTIFMGTYDGSLSAFRLTTKGEGDSEFYQLTPLRKWDFSSAILSMISFGIHRTEDPVITGGKSTTRFGSHLQKQQAP